MGLSNLNNTHLSAAEATAAEDAVTQLEMALTSITANLLAVDRKKYGSINEQNKLFVNKVQDYHKNKPQLQTSQVDWEEFDRDHSSRALMESLIASLESVLAKLNNAKILHDYDNYQAALVDYGYTNFMVGSGAAGYETKIEDLKQFFNRTTPTGETNA